LDFVEDRFTRVVAMSHGAISTNTSEMLRVIGAAMDESIEQAATVVALAPEDHVPRIVLAHEELLRHDGGMVITIPLVVAHQLVGAVLCQFRQPGLAQLVEWEHAFALLGPVLISCVAASALGGDV
jgi:hypothetical protein